MVRNSKIIIKGDRDDVPVTISQNNYGLITKLTRAKNMQTTEKMENKFGHMNEYEKVWTQVEAEKEKTKAKEEL